MPARGGGWPRRLTRGLAVWLMAAAMAASVVDSARSQGPAPESERINAVLTRIRLPEQPTEQAVLEYVVAVLQAASGRYSLTPYDAEVLLLAKVGPSHLGLLLDLIEYDTCGLSFPLINAVSLVATSQHKTRVIEVLRTRPDLADVVFDRGWAADAHDTLVALLADERRAEETGATGLLQRCAELHDPRLVPLLLKRLAVSGAPDEIVAALSGTPGLDLAGAVRTAWDAALAGEADAPLQRWKRLRIAGLALEYGDARALEYLVQDLAVRAERTGESSATTDYEAERQYRKIVRHTGVAETGWRLLAWWDANRERAAWDKSEKRFVPRAGQAWASIPEPAPGTGQTAARPDAGDAKQATEKTATGHAALLSVRIGATPNAAEAREYVCRILELAETHGLWNDPVSDPLVRFLARVGSANTEVLLDAAEGTADPLPGEHLLAAAGLIALEKHKDRIVALLPRHPGAAAAVVLDRDWTAAARPVIPQLLAGEETVLSEMPRDVLRLAASCADPALYPALLDGLKNSLSPGEAYECIRRLPGIEPALGEAICKTWDAVASQTGAPDISRRVALAALALTYGRVSALDFLIHWLAREEPDPGLFSEWRLRELGHAIVRHTDAIGTVPELLDWYESNRDRLTWDPIEKRFLSRGAATVSRVGRGASAPSGPAPLPPSLQELVKIGFPKPATDAALSEFAAAVLRVKVSSTATDNAVGWGLDSTARKVLLAKVGGERVDMLLDLLGRNWDERRAIDVPAVPPQPGDGAGNASDLKAFAGVFRGGAAAVGRAVTPIASTLRLGPGNGEPATAKDVDTEVGPETEGTMRSPAESLVPVIDCLATEAHKTQILKVLEREESLIWVVLAHGWESDAREIVAAKLRNHPAEAPQSLYLDPGWIEAAVQLRDPQTYEDLKWWLVYGWGKANTYALLRTVPDLDLNAPTITAAWRRLIADAGGLAQALQAPDRQEVTGVAMLAARQGNKNAVNCLFRILKESHDAQDSNMEELRFALVRLTPARGTDAEMLRWHAANRGRLVFDRTTKQFNVRASE